MRVKKDYGDKTVGRGVEMSSGRWLLRALTACTGGVAGDDDVVEVADVAWGCGR